jgi:hypothetical protein
MCSRMDIDEYRGGAGGRHRDARDQVMWWDHAEGTAWQKEFNLAHWIAVQQAPARITLRKRFGSLLRRAVQLLEVLKRRRPAAGDA